MYIPNIRYKRYNLLYILLVFALYTHTTYSMQAQLLDQKTIPATASAIATAEAESTQRDQAASQAIVDLTNRMLNSVEVSFIALAQATEEYEIGTPRTHIDKIKQTLAADITTVITMLKQYSGEQTDETLTNPSLSTLCKKLATLITNIQTSSDLHNAIHLYTAILNAYNKQTYKPLELFVTNCSQQLKQANALCDTIARNNPRDPDALLAHITKIQEAWNIYARAARAQRNIVTREYDVHLDFDCTRAARRVSTGTGVLHQRTLEEELAQKNLEKELGQQTFDEVAQYLSEHNAGLNQQSIQPVQAYLKTLAIRMEILFSRFHTATTPIYSGLDSETQALLLEINRNSKKNPKTAGFLPSLYKTVRGTKGAAKSSIRDFFVATAKKKLGLSGASTYDQFIEQETLPFIVTTNQKIDQLQDEVVKFNAAFERILQETDQSIQETEKFLREMSAEAEDKINDVTKKALIEILSLTHETITAAMQPREGLSLLRAEVLKYGQGIINDNPYLTLEQLQEQLHAKISTLAQIATSLTATGNKQIDFVINTTKRQLNSLLAFAHSGINVITNASSLINEYRQTINKKFIGLVENPQTHRIVYTVITTRYDNQDFIRNITAKQASIRAQLLQKRAAFNNKTAELNTIIYTEQEALNTQIDAEFIVRQKATDSLLEINDKIITRQYYQKQLESTIARLKNNSIAIKKTSWIHSATGPLHWIFQKTSSLGFMAFIWRHCSPQYGSKQLEIKKCSRMLTNNTFELNKYRAKAAQLALVISSDSSVIEIKAQRHDAKHAALAQELEKNRLECEKFEQCNHFIRDHLAAEVAEHAHIQRLEQEEHEAQEQARQEEREQARQEEHYEE